MRHSPIHHLVKQPKLANEACTCCGMQAVRTLGSTDTTGHFWCAAHKLRGLILDYGKACHWPNIAIGRYAIGAGADLWLVAIALGDAAMIEAARVAIGIECEEQTA